MLLYACYHIFDCIAGVARGIIRGIGKQKIGALCNLVGYYFVGLPIGVSLMFAKNLGIVGLRSGFLVCVVTQTTVLMVFLVKLNWKKVTEEALVRAGVELTPDAQESAEQIQAVELGSSEARAVEAQKSEGLPGESNEDLEGPSRGEGEDGAAKPRAIVGVVLSFRAVVLRRALVTFAMLLLFAAGLACSILIPQLLK
ncbi:hypothetical protein GJAV_G00139840 [Gymnothorax javanicus]|nr:hypothetical protein GJAV_G00139840 [Gymnothorax javanicus]